MTILAQLVMFAWIPAILVIFAAARPHRAVIAAFLLAWLFLPRFSFPLPGLPDYTKSTATSMGVLLGAILFDLSALATFRPRWSDAPMLAWCLCPFASSVTNDLGAYDGISDCLSHIFTWGIPYFIGRVYLGEPDRVRELAIGFVVGGLIYIPFCLYEIRLSPQLHSQLYGGVGSSVALRYGGYRPSVFMTNGLEVGMWMAGASLLASWLWASGVVKHLSGVSFGRVLLPGLVATTILCKSTGAILLLVVGLAVLWAVTVTRSPVPALVLAAIAPFYCVARTSGVWDGRGLVALSSSSAGEDRAQSLEFRLDNEDMLMARALQRPAFGWGGWGRARVIDENGKDLTITDGLWIIALGNYGIVGLAAVVSVLTLPLILLCRHCPARRWKEPGVAPIAALAVLLVLYMIDNLSNAMFNPVYYLAAGALLSPHALDFDATATVLSDPRGDRGRPEAIEEELRRAEAIEEAAGEGRGDWADAEQAWRIVVEGLESHPHAPARDLAAALGGLGRCLARLGRGNEAAEARGHAVEILDEWAGATRDDPEAVRSLADALNDLAWLLAVGADPRDRDAPRALAAASRAVRLAPEHAPYYNTLGAVLVRSGRWSAAIGAIRRSIALGRREATPFDLLLLSLAHSGLGEADAARLMLLTVDQSTPASIAAHPDFASLRAEAVDLADAPGRDDRGPGLDLAPPLSLTSDLPEP